MHPHGVTGGLNSSGNGFRALLGVLRNEVFQCDTVRRGMLLRVESTRDRRYPPVSVAPCAKPGVGGPCQIPRSPHRGMGEGQKPRQKVVDIAGWNHFFRWTLLSADMSRVARTCCSFTTRSSEGLVEPLGWTAPPAVQSSCNSPPSTRISRRRAADTSAELGLGAFDEWGDKRSSTGCDQE